MTSDLTRSGSRLQSKVQSLRKSTREWCWSVLLSVEVLVSTVWFYLSNNILIQSNRKWKKKTTTLLYFDITICFFFYFFKDFANNKVPFSCLFLLQLLKDELFHLLTDCLFICSTWMFIGWHQHLNPNHCWRCSGCLDSHCSDRLCDWSKKDLCGISDPLSSLFNCPWMSQGFPSFGLKVHLFNWLFIN